MMMMSSLFSSTLFLLLSLLTAGDHAAGCDPRQRESLLQLKAGFQFDYPIDGLLSWLPGSNCCSWEGVTCDHASGLVTELDLDNYRISGNISPTLFNLTSLNKLNLAFNYFQGPIPNGLGLLRDLISLNLYSAGFTGQIPIEIANLTALATLNLSGNFDLKLEEPDFGTLIRNLSNLRELRLDGVNISARGHQWGSAVAKWTPELRVLSLSSTSITGPFDSSLSKLHHLCVILLGYNELNCSVPEFFASFSSLSVLQLDHCELNGTFPKNVFLLKNLTALDLTFNLMLSGSLPEFIYESKLETLKLGDTNFYGSLPNTIGKLTSLITMDLQNCLFSGIIPSSIANLTQLVSLTFMTNNFIGSIPSILPSRISELDLSFNMLNGSIPLSLGKLQHLTFLQLSDNMLSGEIPASLFSLPSLNGLDLSTNQLSGQLLGIVNGSISQLKYVNLGYNRLKGEIPRFVFESSNVEYLMLESNDFSGEVTFDQFGQNLSTLALSNNRISIKDTICDNTSLSFPKLMHLFLASCNLTRLPSVLRCQNQMAFLDLSCNMFYGAIPSWTWSIGAERLYLNLSSNFFTSVEPFKLDANMSNSFWSLDLHSNLLEGPIPLLGISLEAVDYSSNCFSSSIPPNIGLYLGSTFSFSIADNNLIGEIPPSLCEAPLELLDLSNNNFTGLIPRCLLEGDSKLIVLNLQRNQLSGRIPRSNKKGCLLKTLQLNDNHLQGQLPYTIINCNELEVIDLGNNRIHDSFPFWLSRIPSLQVIVLKSNEFYGPIEIHSSTDSSANIFNFSRLQILDLSSNQFNGTLSLQFFMNLRAMMDRSDVEFSTIGSYRITLISAYQVTVTITAKGLEQTLVKILTIFKSIDLSNNAFVGEIPKVFGEFQSLTVLNLSHNSLTGRISPTLGSMMQLESLDLSANHLSGEIPQELTSLTFLGFLNLSNNDLIGTIPQVNQFSTFSNSSFKGNEGLCGIPLSKQCGNNVTEMMPPLKPDNSPSSTYVIGLALSTGLGYGVGIAVVIVLQNVSWKRISAWLRGDATNAMN